MALITRQAKACILIGFNHHSLKIPQEKMGFGLNQIRASLKELLPQYTLMFYPADSSDIEINVFNAFLNFEVAAYENNQIHYPYLSEKIHNLIESEVSALQAQHKIQQTPNEQSNDSEAQKCKLILHWLAVIRNTNKEILSTSCRLTLNIAAAPEITLKNHKNEVLLIANIHSTNKTLSQAINLVLDVQKTAFNSGESSINNEGQIKPNTYGGIDTQLIQEPTPHEDKLVEQYIKKQVEQLKEIDPTGCIEFHNETIWENFITAYRNGAASKLARLTHKSDF